MDDLKRPLPTETLLRYLSAIANDCENTDGWVECAPDIREAADRIRSLEAALDWAEDADPDLIEKIRNYARLSSIGDK